MEIRPLTKSEQKYTYAQSMQIQGKTGSVGHLRGYFEKDGNGLFTSWENHIERLNTDAFREELDDAVNALRSEGYGLLKDRFAMSRYAAQYPESGFEGNCGTVYGFRAETENYAFLFRCSPVQGDYNFYCFCYRKEWLDSHIKKAEQGIRFIDSRYHDLFRIADGEQIVITAEWGEKWEHTCRFIDECHTEIGPSLYHICQFAEIMERNGSTYEPARAEERQPEEKEEKPEGILELETCFGTTENVVLDVNTYADNKSLYVGLTSISCGEPEPYGDVTVNLAANVPPYCAFVDTNNMPELERFLVENRLAEFTGLQQESGYCTYPLYLFNAEKMREYCPDGMAAYERQNGLDKKPGRKEKNR